MVTCKHCGAEIAASAKFCPQCGGKNKKPLYKRPWFIAVIAIIIIGAIGSAGGDKTSNEAGKNDTQVTTSENTNNTQAEPETPEITYTAYSVSELMNDLNGNALKAANKYKEVFGSKVNIYCMVIPTAVEFYCPDKAKKRTNRQLPTIRNVVAHLDPGVKPVDVYTTLGKHADEDIYLRTDHHWSPLGGYYAAQEFARVAGVPFKDLSHYERRVTHGYVGSMYGYSKDISIKNAPEDFVYYVPKGVEYTTTYTNYTINKNYQVTGEGKPYKAAFFFKFKDGHGGAYCTMMGGDTKLTQVRTSTHNGRRVIILKDSFGNMLPGYLFFSFEEVHVIDSRYFTKDIIAYVEENKITDILFANNIFKAYSSHTYGSYLRFLHQQWHRPGADPAKAKGDSAVKHKVHQPEAPKTEKEPSEPVKSTEPVVESKEMAEPTVKERATNQTGSQQ